MNVFLLGNGYIVRKKVPFKACLLGATFLVSAVALAGAAEADDSDINGEADVFTSWIDEGELRAKVAKVAKVTEAVEIAEIESLPQQVAEVIILENSNAANDNNSSDMLAAVDENDIIETVEVAVVDKPLYSPSAAPAALETAAADNSFESPASPNDYKKYGSRKSPWVDPSITLSAEEKAVVDGDINAYFAFNNEPLVANPEYGEAFGNEQGVKVLPLASLGDKAADDAVRTPKTMAASQMHSNFDDTWNNREEASGWVVSEANAADTTLDDILKQGAEGGASPDWLAGTDSSAAPKAAVPAPVAAADAPAPASFAPVPVAPVAPAGTAPTPTPASTPAGGVADSNAVAPFGDAGANYAINVPAPITLSADMNMGGKATATTATPVPSQPLLVPMDTLGSADEDSGFGRGFGYDDTSYNTYNAYGNDYAASYSQGYFAPQTDINSAAPSEKRDVVDTVKDWFGSIISSGEEGKKLDDAVSQYTKRSKKKVEKVAAAAPSQIRITFEKGSSDVSADTVKWLKSFAIKAVADGRKAAEVIMSGKNLRLQSRRFALVRNVLVGYGFDIDDVKPSLSGADSDVLTVNTFSPSRSSGGQGSMNSMGGNF